MDFQPKNERHAIHEVVFVIAFARPLSASELDVVADAHERWAAELPSINRPKVFQVVFSKEGESHDAPPRGVMFEAFKRDGSLDWRLRVEDTWMAVNCLSYTRWQEVWGRARSLLKDAGEVVLKRNNGAAALGLQYVDIFKWDGKDNEYDIGKLLKSDSKSVPESIRDRGHVWHLHQGWFESGEFPISGRLLNRMHIDASVLEDRPQVKMDSLLRLDLEGQMFDLNKLFGEEASIDRVFEDLHIRNKKLMLEYITEDMAKRIQLDA